MVVTRLILSLLVMAAPAAAQTTGDAVSSARPERPIPYPVDVSTGFQRAIEAGTRTETGEPGPEYWQQWADYRLTARLDTEAKELTGTARITYYNNSPDALRVLNLGLHQNLHAEGGVRRVPQEVTGGVNLERVIVDGEELESSTPQFGPPGGQAEPGYSVFATTMTIVPPAPVEPGETVEIEIDYGFRIPRSGASGRMGWNEDDLFFLAYWYPQMAVYDDVDGWFVDPFMGMSEFYAGFADYDVTIEAPAEWLIVATGDLLNAEQTLAPTIRERLARGAASDEVVPVVTEAEFGAAATAGEPGEWLTWHFTASSVHDFTFTATRQSYWDATRTPVGDRDGDGNTDYTLINSLYRASAPKWTEVARYSAHSIAFLSEYTQTPYPWPHMTAVEGGGIIGGGMEFPMMTLIGSYNSRGDSALYYVTAHELAHMWVPMIVSNNERRFSWFDEGTTSFNENNARTDFFPGSAPHESDRGDYLQAARAGIVNEMMRWSDTHPSFASWSIASYDKPATALATLRAVLGEETFNRAYHAFYDRWSWKHPYPWDLFNTFEDVSGQDLDWFWRSWYYETWTLDQAVGSVEAGEDATTIVIEDRGRVPMPVRLSITRADGSTERRVVPVDVWLSGSTSANVRVDGASPVVRVEIDPEGAFPDIDRENNVWSR